MSAKNQNDTNKNNPADDDPNEDDQNEAQPFVTHLIELRSRLLKGLCAILITFSCLFYFANDIYSLIAAPLIEQLSPGSTMIATEVASPFMAPFKLTLFAAIFISMPYLLAQLWGFIAPGLYQQEQRLARPLLISSILLFYAGTAFTYFGEALFGKHLKFERNFSTAFYAAKKDIKARETEESIDASMPQIRIGENIEKQLLLFTNRLD